MRNTEPVSYDPASGTWSVFKYRDAKIVIADHEHFSSRFIETPSEEQPIEASILRTDPPKHKQLRSLVMQAFTPRVIEGFAPQIHSVAENMLDHALAKGKIDAVRDYASPLPIMIIAEMLGIPNEDREKFKQWSDALVGTDYAHYLQCQQDMSDYFALIAEQRRSCMQDDLISNLVRAQDEGAQLSALELIGFCILLLVAGNETTTNLISSALLCLGSRPEDYAEVAADRSLLPQAIEEVLRYCSPVQSMPRRVRKNVVLNGHQFAEGETVDIMIGSANHDEDVFVSPQYFDIHRKSNPHLAFGHGIHFCLGAQLARLEAKIALNVFMDKIRCFQGDREIPLERLDSSFIFGVKQLPLILERR
ncbi:cytochrome P450 [Cohnella silvisoli]|uniref:Cytochrome P450 n=1 Tax=Cohnella silvisoli TaxID=2873699 RepID=A0ABV1KUW2_9BACL|nr:cytochrome P450 [Cohnella silvisoli]